MRQILVLMPEGKPGEPDWEMYGTPLAPLPEGTESMDILAHWTITEPDGKFRGGVESVRIDLKGRV